MASAGPQASEAVSLPSLENQGIFGVVRATVCVGGVLSVPVSPRPASQTLPDCSVFRACPSFLSGSPRKRIPHRPPGWAPQAVLGAGTSKESEGTPMACDGRVFLTLPARHGSTKAPSVSEATQTHPLSETVGVRSQDQATAPGPWWGWVNTDRCLVSLAVQPCWHLFYLSLPPPSSMACLTPTFCGSLPVTSRLEPAAAAQSWCMPTVSSPAERGRPGFGNTVL